MNNDLFIELNRRANPEWSRQFSNRQFEEGLLRLKVVGDLIKEHSDFNPDSVVKLRISIVGTNGKGSTAFALENLFRQGFANFLSDRKYITGLFTSPHLIDVTERIRINGISVSRSELQTGYQSIIEIIQKSSKDRSHRYIEYFESFTYFELLTLLAFYLFQREKLPIEIYEAGLGGRLDATRIANADVVAVTSIGMDHTKLLGHTRKQIFHEKIGILQQNCKLLLLKDSKLKRWLPVLPNVEVVTYDSINQSYLEASQQFAQLIYKSCRSRFQFLSQLPDLSSVHIEAPAGRIEKRKTEKRLFIFDNAHNASALFKLLVDLRNESIQPTTVILAIPKDRRPTPIFRLLNRFELHRILLVEGEGLQQFSTSLQSVSSGIVSLDTAHSLESKFNENDKVVLFVGSHKLYDLFDKVSQVASVVERSV